MNNPQAIYELVRSDGWQEMKSQIKARMDGAMIQLASVSRPPETSDDVLRGHIAGLNWVLEFEKRVNRALAMAAAKKEADKPALEEVGIGSPMTPETTE